MRDLRILTVGSSTCFMTAPVRPTRVDGPYPELLPEILALQGISARSSLRSQWYGMIHEALPRQESYRDTMPDVVILNFGLAECQPNVLPTWINRHFTTWNHGTRPFSRWYRKKPIRPMWKKARQWQRLGSRIVKQRTHRLSPTRFEISMRTLIKLLRNDMQCLVIVLDIDPPDDKVEHFLPGLGQRVARYNEILRQVVSSFDSPEVRLLETSHIVADHGFKAALPDGLHRSPMGHRLVAEEICAEIGPWAKSTLAGVVVEP